MKKLFKPIVLIIIFTVILLTLLSCNILQSNILEFELINNGSEYAVSCNDNNIESIVIPSTYMGLPVTEIGSFSCANLKKIEISDSVTSIGSYAFYDCSNLNAVYITDISKWCAIDFSDGEANPLYYAKNLYLDGELVSGDIVLEGITRIGNYALYNYTGITSITIPDSVTSIGSSAFFGCSSLESITLPFVGATKDGTSNTHFGHIFGSNSNVPESLKTVVITGGTRIDSGSFRFCSHLTSITIPSSVTYIGSNAFERCTSLTSITIPDSVTSIGGNALEDCSNLMSITIPFVGATKDETKNTNFGHIFGSNSNVPESLKTVVITGGTNISSDAFYNCRNLKSVIIPNSITTIGNYAFQYCSELTIYAEPTCQPDGWSSNWNCTDMHASQETRFPVFWSVELYMDGQGIQYALLENNVAHAISCSGTMTSVQIPKTINESIVTNIGFIFLDCAELISITLPSGITSIGSSAFRNCSSLTSITVDENNTNYKSIDGNLYTKDGTTLIQYAIGKIDASFTIPDSVTSIGDAAFLGCSSLTSITIPDSVTSIGKDAFSACTNLIQIENGVSYVDKWVVDCDTSVTSVTLRSDTVGISDYAFQVCSSLASITIPDSVTSIGPNAFYGSSRLTSVHITDISKWCAIDFGNNYANPLYDYFSFHVKNLYLNGELVSGDIVLEGITSIPDYAFYGQTGITSITIPDSVTSIGSSAFYKCSSLNAVYITDISKWCAIDFGDGYANPLEYAKKLYLNGELVTDLVIPEGVTSIGEWAFHCCTSLTSITIPEGVTSIDEGAFYNCSSLTSITIPDSVTSIGYEAFGYCTSLTSITIPEGVTSIGDDAFENCSSLTSITIPDSVTSIGDYAFGGCSILTSITIPDGVTSIGDYAFYDCYGITSITVDENNEYYKSIYGNLYTKDGKTLIQYAVGKTDASFTIPDSVTSIGDRAFFGCSSLTSITIPDSVTSIGDEAFCGCSSLTSLTIPEGVTSIGDYAFCNCSSLTSITIPDSITSIGESVFCNCTSLTSITIPDGVTNIGSWAFYNCTSLTSITIPEGVTSIGNCAFYYCSGLTSINHSGTIDEWNLITKGYDWNYSTGNYTIYCTDGEIAKS